MIRKDQGRGRMLCNPDSKRTSLRALRPRLAHWGTRLALLAIALAAPLATASAATYYVSPSGSDSNNGTSPGSAWATIGKANSTLRAGDVCIIANGTYSNSPNPSVDGTANARITYVGNQANPAAVSVPGLTLTRQYVTIKGVAMSGGLTLEHPARRDSIAYCHTGGVAFQGAKWSIVTRCRITGTVKFMQDLGQSFDGIANSEFDTLRYNHINLSIPPGHGFKARGFAQNCVIDSNRIFGTYGANTVDGVARIFYNSSYFTLRDNYWKFEASQAMGGGEPWNGFVMRDSAHHYVFERDTLLMGTESAYGIRGQFIGGGTWSNSVYNVTYKDCVYKLNSYVLTVGTLADHTFENCVFATSGNMLWWLADPVRNLRLRHNTFWTNKLTFLFEGSLSGTNEMTSNIFYSRNPDPTTNQQGGIVMFASGTSPMTSNNNLFYSPANGGDRAIGWCCWSGSAPGTGRPWYNQTGQDGLSKYGSRGPAPSPRGWASAAPTPASSWRRSAPTSRRRARSTTSPRSS
jgi:hypothetical protein